jgi:hypothetical protein
MQTMASGDRSSFSRARSVVHCGWWYAQTAAALALALAGNAAAATHTVIYSFADQSVGSLPGAPLIIDKSGALYGSTISGGTSQGNNGAGWGTIFKLSPPASGKTKWSFTRLHSFDGDGGGGEIYSALLPNPASGGFYGFTFLGGRCSSPSNGGCGVAFAFNPPGSGHTVWDLSTLYRFGGDVVADGEYPVGTPIADATGALYGVTEAGGPRNDHNQGGGTIFKLSPPSAGQSL